MHLVLRIAALAVAAAFQAQGISALVSATLTGPPSPVADVAPSAASPSIEKSAASILAHNPFEHASPPVVVTDSSPACEGVRALVTVRGENQEDSLAALAVGENRVLRRRGDEVANMQIAWIDADRVWLTNADRTCEARVFVHPEPKRHPEEEPKGIKGIERASPTEFAIDRGTLDRLLDSPAELAKVRIVPESRGVRIAKVPPNSALAQLGIEDNDVIVSALGVEVTSPEKIMELYARLRTGTLSRVTLSIVRKGQPMTLDYAVR